MINIFTDIVYQITNVNGTWFRSVVKIIGASDANPIDLTIAVHPTPTIFDAKYYGTGKEYLKFYTDGLNLYLKINTKNTLSEITVYSMNTVRGYFKAKKSDMTIDKLTEYIF